MLKEPDSILHDHFTFFLYNKCNDFLFISIIGWTMNMLNSEEKKQ